MKSTQLFFLFVFAGLIGVSTGAMQPQREPEIPFEVKNDSPVVITVIQDDTSNMHGGVQWVTIKPGKSTNVNKKKTPIVLRLGEEIGFATAKGYFGIGMESDFSLVLAQEKTGLGWTEIQKGIPTANATKGIITVNSEGIPHVSLVMPKPNDGRPDVPLSVYAKLTGSESYASPQEILGLKPGVDARRAYILKVTQWHPDKNKSPEAADAFKLINWAAERLGAK